MRAKWRIERLSEAASHQSSTNYVGCPCSSERNEERREGDGRQGAGYWLIINSGFGLSQRRKIEAIFIG